MVISTITSDLTKCSLKFIFNFPSFIKRNSGNEPDAFVPCQSWRNKSAVLIPWSRAILRSSQCLIWSRNSTPSLEPERSLLGYELHPSELITNQLENSTTLHSISIKLVLILSSSTCSGILGCWMLRRFREVAGRYRYIGKLDWLITNNFVLYDSESQNRIRRW
jgi:hypothetical protein